MSLTCGVLVWDRKATEHGVVVFRTCGATTEQTVEIGGDHLLASCSRHNRRIDRLNDKLRRAQTATAPSEDPR